MPLKQQLFYLSHPNNSAQFSWQDFGAYLNNIEKHRLSIYWNFYIFKAPKSVVASLKPLHHNFSQIKQNSNAVENYLLAFPAQN